MADLLSGVSVLEATAVVFAAAYLVLAIRQIVWCWLAAFIASILSVFVFEAVQLYMQSALQIFYAAMAVYGWWQWTRRGPDEERAVRVHTWPPYRHGVTLVSLAGVSALFAWGLSYTA